MRSILHQSSTLRTGRQCSPTIDTQVIQRLSWSTTFSPNFNSYKAYQANSANDLSNTVKSGWTWTFFNGVIDCKDRVFPDLPASTTPLTFIAGPGCPPIQSLLIPVQRVNGTEQISIATNKAQLERQQIIVDPHPVCQMSALQNLLHCSNTLMTTTRNYCKTLLLSQTHCKTATYHTSSQFKQTSLKIYPYAARNYIIKLPHDTSRGSFKLETTSSWYGHQDLQILSEINHNWKQSLKFSINFYRVQSPAFRTIKVAQWHETTWTRARTKGFRSRGGAKAIVTPRLLPLRSRCEGDG